MNDIRELLPQDKIDTERAEAVISAGFPAIEPILPDLMEWLQDCNWPVFQTLAPFLPSLGLVLVPHINYVFGTDDYTWKYYVILALLRESPELAAAFRSELIRLVTAPTEIEKAEGLDQAALQVLDKYGLTKGN